VSVAAHNASPPCTTCAFDESDLALPPYWLEGDTPEPPPRLLSKNFLDNETFRGVSETFYTFLKRTFIPHSIVTIELHSEVRKIGQAVVLGDGSLAGKLQLPLDVEGYHTVHVLGTSYAGEPIDIYQTVFISGEGEKTDKNTTNTSIKSTPAQGLHSVVTESTEEEGSAAVHGASAKVVSTEGSSLVKGSQDEAVSSLQKDKLSIKMPPWFSWIGISGVLGSALFLLWWIFFKKPKL